MALLYFCANFKNALLFTFSNLAFRHFWGHLVYLFAQCKWGRGCSGGVFFPISVPIISKFTLGIRQNRKQKISVSDSIPKSAKVYTFFRECLRENRPISTVQEHLNTRNTKLDSRHSIPKVLDLAPFPQLTPLE